MGITLSLRASCLAWGHTHSLGASGKWGVFASTRSNSSESLSSKTSWDSLRPPLHGHHNLISPSTQSCIPHSLEVLLPGHSPVDLLHIISISKPIFLGSWPATNMKSNFLSSAINNFWPISDIQWQERIINKRASGRQQIHQYKKWE